MGAEHVNNLFTLSKGTLVSTETTLGETEGTTVTTELDDFNKTLFVGSETGHFTNNGTNDGVTSRSTRGDGLRNALSDNVTRKNKHLDFSMFSDVNGEK